MRTEHTHSFADLHDDDLLTTKQAAEWFQLTPRTLHDWRYKGGGPKFVAISRSVVRYRVGDLREFSAKRRRTNTSGGVA